MKLSIVFAVLISTLGLSTGNPAHAYPDLTKPIGTNGLPLKVFKDHEKEIYWYIPLSVEPWKLDNQYRSAFTRTDSSLAFIFRGQQNVSEDMIREVAKANKLRFADFTPVFYEYSKDLVCQNIYAGDPNVVWLFPTQIGNYLEVVPVSIRVKNDRALANEVEALIKGGGLACTVSVGFKAWTMAYKASYTFDLNQVYTRFEAGVHAEGMFWEVDIHTILQKMKQDGVFKFHLDEDTTIDQTTLDQKMTASFEDLEKRIVDLLFTAAPKIPAGGLADRGKPFSLRTDYVRSDFNANYVLHLSSDKLKVKDSQIGIRMGLN